MSTRHKVRRLRSSEEAFAAHFDELLLLKRETDEDVGAAVAQIVSDVKTDGDRAVEAYTEKFDRVSKSGPKMEFAAAELAQARAACSNEQIEALELAAERIRAFHIRQMPQDDHFADELGVELGSRWTPVSAAGIYVPGGKASYPSSVLMNAIPAKVAGVSSVIMVVPTPGGAFDPLVLAAADIAGVDRVFRIGGAQAIAALAFGTRTVPRVDKIVGPGNAYVAAAKRQVFGQVGIDMIAGPSEILVVADEQNDPSWIAADLLSQAEHDETAQSILITDNEDFADAVELAVEAQLNTLPRQAVARPSWEQYGAIICVDDLDEAVPLVDALAPEHLELAVADPAALFDKVRNAGAVFLGRYTPEAIGDYIAGTNHVLPTARSAKYASGLSVLDFMKRTSFVRCDAESLSRIGEAAVVLAKSEGLDAHARSITIRSNT